MDKYDEISNEIIEKICDWIEDNYNIKPKSFDDPDLENPALINGIAYYDMEGEISQILKEFVKQQKVKK